LPLALTDDALATLMRLAEPIDRELRAPFLEAVAVELRNHQDVVDSGLAYRTGRALQAEFLPGLVLPEHLPHRGKYG
jgi:hypothetical protein